jgi:iron-sulfur cluster repair protein YtfE (RIC family)
MRTGGDVQELGALMLEQHAGLRRRVDRCAELSVRLLRGEAVEVELAAELAHLREQFGAHVDAEERLLEPALSASDAWGPLRVGRMIEEHEAEHHAFTERLVGDTRAVAARFAEFAEELDAHIAAEERTFLSPKVLADAAAAQAARTRR